MLAGPTTVCTPTRRRFDLDRGEAHAIAFVQYLVGGGGLPIDTDQIIVRVTAGDLLREQNLDRGPLGDLDVVCNPAPLLLMYINRICNVS